ncbi:uncharacterized protein LOC134252223 [Saccostrea cucullata]|uniref:uncharacterized protein LOC134252223 n=1 Tax=Saccostrea cuccullata TaxID=36930 RepID=UPI002ED66F72
MSGLQYPFYVFTVEQCPKDRASWNASSTVRGCPVDVNGRSTYHCVPNQQLTTLIEFCYNRQTGLYESGTCLYLTNSGYLNQVRCADFTHGCPEKPYFSNEIYKYQECLAINKQFHCYEAAESCRNTKNSKDVSSSTPTTSLSYIPILLGVMVPIILIVILLCSLFIKFQRERNSSNKDTMDPEQEHLLQKGNPGEEFIETRAYQKAREVLLKKKYVFIKGNPGDGKTTIAKHLLKELKTSHNKREKVVMGLKELCGKHDQTKDIAFFVDNIFGEYNFRRSEIEQWETTTIFMESVLSDEIDQKGNFLIATIRNDMYSEILTKLQFKMEFIENALVDISNSENKLTKEEMKQMYDLYVRIPFRADELYSAFSCAPPLGFPQSCKLFGNNTTLQSRGPNFFKNPSECLSQYVENMYWHSKPQFSVLVYILMTNDNKVSMSSLRNLNIDIEGKRKAMTVHPKNKKSPIPTEFIECIDGLMGSFLIDESGFCTFSHSCIQNVIQNTIIKFHTIFVIKHCQISLLNNLQVEGKGEMAENIQTIEKDYFADIFKRIVENLNFRSSELFKIISGLHLWKNDAFCSAFKDYVHQKENILSELDENDASLLIYFAKAGQNEMVKFLLTIIKTNKQRYEALNQATLMNHSKVVQILLDEGVTPDVKSCFCAIQNGDLDMVKQFISKGLNIMEFSKSLHPSFQRSVSILAESCLWERLEIISFLENYPDLFNVKYDFGEHTIHFIAYAGAIDALKALITKHKCDPSLKTNRGETILHNACQNGKLETVKYIISEYPKLLSEENDLFDGGSILHMVAAGGSIELFKLLKNQKLITEHETGRTVLHSACQHGRFEMSKFLLDRFPYLLTKINFFGESALHDSVRGGNVELMNFLLKKGLDINDRNNYGKSMLHLCCIEGKIDICKYLVNTYPFLLEVTDNNGHNVLHDAVWGGNIDLAKFLLEKGLDINSTRSDGKTVLHQCCMNGQTDMCKYLVNTYPFLLEVTDNNGHNVLHDAVWGGNIDLAKFLLEKGLDIKSTRSDGNTVLHLCCMNGQIEMCKYLVNTYPFLLDVSDDSGENVLHDAAFGGNIEMLKFLLDKGLDIKSTRSDGKTVLHLCCLNDKIDMCKFLVNTYPFLLDVIDDSGENVLHDSAFGVNIEMLKFLLDKGLDIKSTRSDGKTVLHLCCLSDKIDMCKYLVNTYPFLLEVTDNNGHNVLHDAVWGGNIDLAKFLLEKGLDINSTRSDGKTVLHLCCMNGQTDMCKYLVNTYPFLLEVTDNNGHDVLHDAVWGGNIDLAKFLLEKGLDIKSTRSDGNTVLHQCCMNGQIEMCKYLVNTYPFLLDVSDDSGENVLHDAAFGGNIEMLKFLLDKGLDINSTRSDGKTVLHLCCLNDKIDMCKYLVNTYPFLLEVTDNNGHNVLHDAVWGGNIDLAKFLLEKGLDINSTRSDGKTVLHLCCLNDKIDMCKFLVNTYPFLLDVIDDSGENVLHDSAFGGNIEMLKFLLDKCLDINSTRSDGKTVLHLCCLNDKIDMCKYLVNTYPFLLDFTDNDGNNALHEAVCGGNIDLAKFLLEKGLDIKSSIHSGKSVLHLSCLNSKMDMCKYIVNTYPFLLDVIDDNGENVLHDAAWDGNIEILKFLLDRGLDIKSTRSDGKTVLHLCCLNDKIDMCEFLVNTYPDLLDVTDNDGENALHDAVWGGNIDLAKFLLEEGLDIKSTRSDGKTVLHQCCMNGQTDMCKYLVNTCPFLLDVTDNDGENALHDAACSGNVDLVIFLIEKGLDIKSTSSDGKTVLNLCCLDDKMDMCKYLVNKYPDLLDVTDNDGQNALHEAAWSGNVEILKFLVDKGLDIYSARDDGKTVLHMCCMNREKEMYKYLFDKYPDLVDIEDKYGNKAVFYGI